MIDSILQLLIDWGAVGMFLSAFLAGSVFPFPSEVVIGGLYAAGASGWSLLWSASLGNTLGGMFNYWLGTLGDEAAVVRRFKISPSKWEKNKRWVQQYGFWAGMVSWVPFLGSAITVAQGFMRVNLWLCTATSAFGKVLRYILILMALRAAA